MMITRALQAKRNGKTKSYEALLFNLLVIWLLATLLHSGTQIFADPRSTSHDSLHLGGLARPGRDIATKTLGSASLPESPLYIITPCSRPEYLQHIRSTLADDYQWVWIIVYSFKPKTWTFASAPFIYEVWPGIKPTDVDDARDELQTFGNPERNYGISLVEHQNSYIYFLDDDNGIHPAFWERIYPLLVTSSTAASDFITFDQERAPGRVFPGPQAMLFKIDTAMYVTQRALIGDARWRTLRYDADGFFAQKMAAKARHHHYVNCTCSFYNFLKQNFSTPRNF
jgi:hypothetical protein